MEQLIKQHVELANQIVEYGKVKNILISNHWETIIGMFLDDDVISIYRGKDDETFAVKIGIVEISLYSKKIEFPYDRIDELQLNFDMMHDRFCSFVKTEWVDKLIEEKVSTEG